MSRWMVVAVALVVAAGTHVVALAAGFFGTCAVSDTANTIPAPASAQGRVCDAVTSTGPGTYVALVLIVTSVLLAIVLAVRGWGSTSRWRAAGLTACLWLPPLGLVGFSAPPDSCTDGQREALPAYECSRGGNG